MNVSPDGRAFIALEEGTVLHEYADAAGKLTIGTGHLLRPGETYPNGITQEQADALLANDLRVAESVVNHHVTAILSQCSFDACCCLAFNIGGGAFAGSTVAQRINAGDMAGAADAFLMWNKISLCGQLVPDQALAARRMRERLLFLRDVSTTDEA